MEDMEAMMVRPARLVGSWILSQVWKGIRGNITSWWKKEGESPVSIKKYQILKHLLGLCGLQLACLSLLPIPMPCTICDCFFTTTGKKTLCFMKVFSLLVTNLGCSSSEYLAIYHFSHLFSLVVPTFMPLWLSCPCMLGKRALAPLWETALCSPVFYEGGKVVIHSLGVLFILLCSSTLKIPVASLWRRWYFPHVTIWH